MDWLLEKYWAERVCKVTGKALEPGEFSCAHQGCRNTAQFAPTARLQVLS